MRRFTLFVCVLALVIAAPAGAVVGGSADTAHPYVGVVVDQTTVCSGTLIAPTLMVTAGHCFPDGGSVLVSFAQHPADLSTTGIPGVVHVDPQYCGGCAGGTNGVQSHDLAVVVLAKSQSGPFASLPGMNLADSLPAHAPVTLVGYGAQGYDGGGKKAAAIDLHLRYAGDATLATSGGKLGDSFIKLSGSNGNATPCFGDSGGPALLAGTNTIIGVVSWARGSVGCNGTSFAYRVDTLDALGFIGNVR
jgi:secreted trypsin-like serine protease